MEVIKWAGKWPGAEGRSWSGNGGGRLKVTAILALGFFLFGSGCHLIRFKDQLATPSGPILLVNQFEVSPEDRARFEEVFARIGTFMKTQPGYLAHHLHHPLPPSRQYVNLARWRSTVDLKRALEQAEFQRLRKELPVGPSDVRPVLYRVPFETHGQRKRQ